MCKEFAKFDHDRNKFIVHEGISSKTKKPYRIDVGYEQFLAPELYFNPEIIAPDYTEPLYKVVDNCILKCPIDTRRQLYSNIVLAGGSTLFKVYSRDYSLLWSRDLLIVWRRISPESPMSVSPPIIKRFSLIWAIPKWFRKRRWRSTSWIQKTDSTPLILVDASLRPMYVFSVRCDL